MSQIAAPEPLADTPDDEPVDKRQLSGARAFALRVANYHTGAVGVVLAILIIYFGIRDPGAFLTLGNLRIVALDAMSIMLLAVGMTYLILSGGIDLSVGAVVVFASVISGESMAGLSNSWGTVLIGLVVALASGALWGLINGVLVARGRLSALIVTLGTLGAAQGLAEIITKGQDLATFPAKLTNTLGVGRFVGIPWVLWITIVITVVAGIVLAKTRFGARTYAIGANEEAARRAGIRVDRHKIVLYVMTGVLAGVTAFLLNAYFGTTTISGHSTDNLAAITAVLLGGVSLFGGEGNMVGSVIGVFIPAVLTDGFTITGVQSFWQEVAVGVILIGAVGLDRVRRQGREAR